MARRIIWRRVAKMEEQIGRRWRGDRKVEEEVKSCSGRGDMKK